MTDSTEINPERVTKLMEGIGRCIYIYQRIEVLLKLLLPHIVDPKNNAELQSSYNWRIFLDSKQTLGPLVNKLTDKMEGDNPIVFETYMAKLVEQRNELVHHFFCTPSKCTNTNIDVENKINSIRSRIKYAIPFMHALEEIAQLFVSDLEKSILEDKQ